MVVKDKDIRAVLLSTLREKYKNDNGTLVIEELGLCQGDARIDLAVVNGAMHGFEIKSEKDTLARLCSQQEVYCKVLDCVTVVASTKHINKVLKGVPLWWGIDEAKQIQDRLEIQEIRPCSRNPKLEPESLVQLLWREEALNALKNRGLQRGIASKPRSVLWGKLVDKLHVEELKKVVRDSIRARGDWRSGQLQE